MLICGALNLSVSSTKSAAVVGNEEVVSSKASSPSKPKPRKSHLEKSDSVEDTKGIADNGDGEMAFASLTPEVDLPLQS